MRNNVEPVICKGCGQEIDPDTCGCGGEPEDAEHTSPVCYTHPFIPMGCDCYRAKPDAIAKLRELTQNAGKKP